MDLKKEREKITEQLQRNRLDIMKHEQNLEGLRNGALFLEGQLTLIDNLIAADEKDKAEKSPKKSKKESKDENVSADLQSAPVSTPSGQSSGKRDDSGPAARNNRKSGN